MTDMAVRHTRPIAVAPLIFGGAIFLSASLVFLVQPMIARMLLPTLGGSPAVWNASMAFFQVALLFGYAYAHLLQKVRSLRHQAIIHLGVLGLAGLVLPLRATEVFGLSPVETPTLWLLGVLTVSVGAPFIALSATAPLMQAWFARSQAPGDRADPYVLYAASNVGSLLALAAYPLLVEAAFDLTGQGRLWTYGYAFFGGVAVLTAVGLRGAAGAVDPTQARVLSPPVSWKRKLTWVGLAAVPSSLLLGVTSHITTDVASAPFLWVLPLALYLLTFVVAFQAKPLIPARSALLQAAAVACVAATMYGQTDNWAALLGLSLLLFFLTALVCHQALAAGRPAPDRLTEFYLLMSLGGVVGGVFTAFVAPVLFDFVWEYPAALVLAGLARPWGEGPLSRLERAALIFGTAALAGSTLLMQVEAPKAVHLAGFGVAAVAVFALRDRAVLFTLLLAGLIVQTSSRAVASDVLEAERGFFGVHRVADHEGASGPMRLLYHGTTLHGAQALDPSRRCVPLTYYSPQSPIGRTFAATAARTQGARIGATGLGAGAVAAYARPGDRLTFFEIDPLVASLAQDRRYFTYLSDCAQGSVDLVMGDARLTLARQPDGGFDHLLMDAFSSDSVPTHLLTREAVELYFRKLAPDGLLVVHLSNRHLELTGPVAAAVREAGGHALVERFRPPAGTDPIEVTSSKVLIAAKDPKVLDAFRRDPRWTTPAARRAWTDDHVDLIEAMRAGSRE
jgi:SAM-dependent methyltransferase